MSSFVYVSEMGALYRLTRTQWRRFLTDCLAGDRRDLSTYGTYITGQIENVTDLCKEHAQDRLDEMKASRQ